MSTIESQELGCDEKKPLEEIMSLSGGKKGGWITIPFVIGGLTGLTIGGSAITVNLMVYLIKEFNMNGIDAAQISNVVNGCSCFFPVLGAIIADSFLGCFPVVSLSSLITLLGMAIFVLTATIDSLRPPSGLSPSRLQYGVLYAAITVVAIGWGGWRFCIATMGANQFNKATDQAKFFNCFFIASYSATAIGLTVIVYVQDSLSWGLGFGLSLVSASIASVLFLLGKRFYCEDKPQGSPFVDLARVVIACVKKRNIASSLRSEDYYFGDDGNSKMVQEMPSKSFRYVYEHVGWL